MIFEPVKKPFSESKKTYESAEIILSGIPLDVSASFRQGVKFAPSHIREISWHIEDYNYLTDENILDVPFFDAGNLILSGDLNNNFNEIKSQIKKILEDRKIPVCVGGEHLISLPIIESLHQSYPDLYVIVFDAHTDLSDEYRKMKISHASVMRLVYDILGDGRIFMFGTRTGTKEDKEFLNEKIFSSPNPPVIELLEKIKDKPVYISIDVDVLDPSIAPGVSTPELGGWSFNDLYKTIRMLDTLNKITGVDIVEICPPYDPSEITSLIGAKLLREVLFLLSRTQKK